MEAGNINPNIKTDNTIDSSDSPVFDDTEVSDFHFDSIWVGPVVLSTEREQRMTSNADGIFNEVETKMQIPCLNGKTYAQYFKSSVKDDRQQPFVTRKIKWE